MQKNTGACVSMEQFAISLLPAAPSSMVSEMLLSHVADRLCCCFLFLHLSPLLEGILKAHSGTSTAAGLTCFLSLPNPARHVCQLQTRSDGRMWHFHRIVYNFGWTSFSRPQGAEAPLKADDWIVLPAVVGLARSFAATAHYS